MQNDTIHENFSPHESDSTHESDALRDAALAALDAEKIDDVTVINLLGRSSLADFMIIGTGSSSRRVAAAAQKVMSALKPLCKRTPTCEGLAVGDWVLVDAGDVGVHRAVDRPVKNRARRYRERLVPHL